MELSKRNETIWVVKRTNKPGRFLLRSVEEAGDYIEFSIGMESENSKLMFDMDKDEFENFYKILTNFKNLIEGSPSGYSDTASGNLGVLKKPLNSPTNPPATPPSVAEIPQLSLDGNIAPKELIDKSYSHLDDIDANDMSLASLGELDEAEELSSELNLEDKNLDTISVNTTPKSVVSTSNPPSIPKNTPQNSHSIDEEDDSEDLMAKISEMAAKLQNIPPPKPIAGVATKPLPMKMPLAAPTVTNEMVKNLPITEKESTPKSVSGKKKGPELKESDWDPW